jgi:hypothetical protein
MMRPFAVMSEGLQRSDTAVHEWVDLFVYWLTNAAQSCFRSQLKTPFEGSCR